MAENLYDLREASQVMRLENDAIAEAGMDGVMFGQTDCGSICAEFMHAGLECFATVNALGIPCGYVRVDEVEDEVQDKDIDWEEIPVHGGVTFEGSLADMTGQAGKWIGFDMGHGSDDRGEVDVLEDGESFLGVPLKMFVKRSTWNKTIKDAVVETKRLAEGVAEYVVSVRGQVLEG